jgi:hypothetical protein
MATFTERAVDAMMAMLTDGATGLNAVTLPTLRASLGITTAELPDIQTVEAWYHRAEQANAFPYASVVVAGTTGEREPNSRFYTVSFDLGLVVLDQDIAGNEVDVMVAAWRYGDAIKTIFQRRVGAGSQGWTLGTASGIIRATVTGQQVGADPGLAVPNVALLTTIEVVTSEEY